MSRKPPLELYACKQRSGTYTWHLPHLNFLTKFHITLYIFFLFFSVRLKINFENREMRLKLHDLHYTLFRKNKKKYSNNYSPEIFITKVHYLHAQIAQGKGIDRQNTHVPPVDQLWVGMHGICYLFLQICIHLDSNF